MMGFFGKKKPKEMKEQKNEHELADLPDFSSAKTDDDFKFPEFPEYESKEIDAYNDSYNTPIAEPTRAEDFIQKGMEMPMRKEMPRMEMPMEEHEDFQMQRPMQQEEGRPIFIKLDDYKDAIHTLDIIKARLRETEKILNEISNLRREEDRELENWKSDLERMKEKILYIDTNLFGE